MIRTTRRLLATLAAVLAACLLVSPTSAYATYPTSPNVYYYGDNVCSNACHLYPGELDLYSANGRDHLGFGRSGNFAGYDSSGRMWFQSGTTNYGRELRFQADGNVVVYDAGPQGDFLGQRALWASGTSYAYDYHAWRLTMGGDGHFSIWRKLVLDTSGNWTWERVKSFGDGS